MNKYVALLRGINVGGHKSIKMEDLNRAFTSLKFKNVKTLITSGNVIFEAAGKDEDALTRQIVVKLGQAFGYDIPVMIRSIAYIEKLRKADPFKKIKASPDVKNYVAFLSAEPKGPVKIPKAPAGESWEILGIKGREVFITTRRKKDGHNGFPNNFIEKGLGVTATTRNWNTVGKLLLP